MNQRRTLAPGAGQNTAVAWANSAGLSNVLMRGFTTFAVFAFASNVGLTFTRHSSNSAVLSSARTSSGALSRLFETVSKLTTPPELVVWPALNTFVQSFLSCFLRHDFVVPRPRFVHVAALPRLCEPDEALNDPVVGQWDSHGSHFSIHPVVACFARSTRCAIIIARGRPTNIVSCSAPGLPCKLRTKESRRAKESRGILFDDCYSSMTETDSDVSALRSPSTSATPGCASYSASVTGSLIVFLFPRSLKQTHPGYSRRSPVKSDGVFALGSVAGTFNQAICEIRLRRRRENT
ncbi:hypothetical protein PSP31121_04804 [Pandoraea sputorum]|uniref:Uncharacterized protein n=1 Tax=Pandoraea sputorum TaxID=93222 RepID=A0A5E5BJ30_9BURK|nr:hypothetical protein PSP31121_04804 [Pandoraea sputorum]